jgi:hypothetical protein
MQLAARLVHGVNNNASAIESIHRKRISAFTLSALKISFPTAVSASTGERSPATASLVQ